MEAFFELLKYTIPGLIVFATSYFMMKSQLDADFRKKQIETRANNQKIITPIRLQAYERLSMFLERINPESLLFRVLESGMSVSDFQSALLITVRAEYEHNLTQQIYVSGKTWYAVKGAKDNVVRLINQSAGALDPKAPAAELSKRIMQTIMAIDKTPTQIGLELIKLEAGHFM